MTEVKSVLEALPFWDRLSDSEKDFARRNSAIRRAPAGSLLYSLDCACVGMVHVISGTVRIYLLSPEGREVTLFRLGAGKTCVLSAACVVRQISLDTHMMTETDCELLVMNAEAFGRLTDENVWARSFLFELASENLTSIMHTMERILFSRFDSRLASFLVAEHERTGETELRMTQSEIAERVNSAREVVARMLGEFEREGLVRKRRGSLILIDIDGLRAKQ